VEKPVQYRHDLCSYNGCVTRGSVDNGARKGLVYTGGFRLASDRPRAIPHS